MKEVRPELDIQVQEGLGALIAVFVAQDMLKEKCVTIYNDNPGAAAAIITKAPPLWRNDMQYIARKLAMFAVENHTMYWGIKIDGKHNEYADALSRFNTNYDWNALGYTLIDVTDITNQLLLELKNYYPNRQQSEWEWNDEQREMLRISKTKKLINDKVTSKTKCKPNPPKHNILTKKNFDDFW